MKEKITYRDLEAVLLDLGFEKHIVKNAIYYREVSSGAIVALPVVSLEAPVMLHHYAMARMEVDGMGVADKKDFERTMRERGDLPAGITTVI